MGTLIANLIRKVAEGDFGKRAAVAYWWLAGKKTWSGLVVGAAYYGLTRAAEAGLCYDCASWAGYLLSASLFLVGVGLVDAGVRARPPYKEIG